MGHPEDAVALFHHGGNINAARRRFPTAPSPWIDLSTGINPHPYPIGDMSPDAWTRLPDPADLEAAARTAYAIPPSAAIVAAPGTQALIQWLPTLFPARRVGILGLTYGEHESAWRRAGATVGIVAEPHALVDFDAGVVVNPNNPDGRLLPPADLAHLAARLADRGGRLIVDEAFIDVLAPGCSLAPTLPAGALILRSFGKTYGLAGLRLGFAIAALDDADRIRAALGPWPVSGPAIALGRRALDDAAWLAATRDHLRADAARLDALLRAAGFSILGGTPLYRLGRHPDAPTWFERLGRAGILTRPFPARPDWLRFGIPPSPEAWNRVVASLRGCDPLLAVPGLIPTLE